MFNLRNKETNLRLSEVKSKSIDSKVITLVGTKYLISKNSEYYDFTDGKLYEAIRTNKIKFTKYIMKQSEINIFIFYRILGNLIKKGRFKMFNLLVKHHKKTRIDREIIYDLVNKKLYTCLRNLLKHHGEFSSYYGIIGHDDNLLLEVTEIWDAETVKIMLECGAKSSQVNKYEENALHFAVKQNKYNIVMLILDGLINVNQTNICGHTALHKAVFKNNFRMVKLLLTKYFIKLDQIGYNGKTILFYAIDGGNYDIIKMLVEKGAPINHVNNDGNTVLHRVVRRDYKNHTKRQLDIINLLLRNGVKADVKNLKNLSPIDIVNQEKNNRITQLLIGHHYLNRKYTPLQDFSKNGKIELLKFQISSGANLNAGKDVGLTPVILAAMNGFDKCVKVLLDAGAEKNVNILNFSQKQSISRFPKCKLLLGL